MKFLVFACGEVVGWSALPFLDRGMSIVSGVFLPNENYAAIQPLMLRYQSEHNPVELVQVRKDIAALELRVQTEDGRWLEADNGVYLADFSEELDSDAIELNVMCAGWEIAKELWPEKE